MMSSVHDDDGEAAVSRFCSCLPSVALTVMFFRESSSLVFPRAVLCPFCGGAEESLCV